MMPSARGRGYVLNTYSVGHYTTNEHAITEKSVWRSEPCDQELLK